MYFKLRQDLPGALLEKGDRAFLGIARNLISGGKDTAVLLNALEDLAGATDGDLAEKEGMLIVRLSEGAEDEKDFVRDLRRLFNVLPLELVLDEPDLLSDDVTVLTQCAGRVIRRTVDVCVNSADPRNVQCSGSFLRGFAALAAAGLAKLAPEDHPQSPEPCVPDDSTMPVNLYFIGLTRVGAPSIGA
ncbi:MAG: hypothetical protein SPL30_06515 [Succinivibrio sp.]|nr:hypothetical protein [Succinivibrio sp.]